MPPGSGRWSTFGRGPSSASTAARSGSAPISISTHWLERKGIAYDTIADENLHHEGEALLAPYQVVVTGTHPEYWTRPMLDALDRYLDNGGRLMYLGGNGFYWVTGVDPRAVRTSSRSGAGAGPRPGRRRRVRSFSAPPASKAGYGGNRNRAPQKRLGVGFTAQGNDFARPYVRLPDSDDPARRVHLRRGRTGDTIGDFPSLMLRHGAGGLRNRPR